MQYFAFLYFLSILFNIMFRNLSSFGCLHPSFISSKKNSPRKTVTITKTYESFMMFFKYPPQSKIYLASKHMSFMII